MTPRGSKRESDDFRFETCPEELDDEYEGLSVIHVTPRLPDLKSYIEKELKSAYDDEQESFNRRSDGSDCSFSLSTGPASMKSRKEPSSILLFLSSIKNGWSKSPATSAELEDPTFYNFPSSPSPSSVMQRNFSLSGGSRSLELDAGEEKELLDRRLFSSLNDAHAGEFQDFLREHQAERERSPVLCLVDYGGDGAHASDIWVLMHNTIRRELFDVFEIINTIHRGYLQMTLNDVYNLRKWWRFFVVLWSEYVNHEKSLLDPIVHKICLVDGRSDVLLKRLEPLRETREWLNLKMEEITSYIEEFEKLPPGRALCLFCKTVDSFGDRAMIYFAGVEKLLPRFVESYHGEEIKASIEGQLIERLRNGTYFAEMIVALVRWMGTVQGYSTSKSQSKEREKWLNTYLFWLERQSLPRYYRKYDASHGRVLTYFRERLKKADPS